MVRNPWGTSSGSNFIFLMFCLLGFKTQIVFGKKVGGRRNGVIMCVYENPRVREATTK